MIHGGANGILFTGTDGKVEVNRGHFQTWPAELADALTDSIRTRTVNHLTPPQARVPLATACEA